MELRVLDAAIIGPVHAPAEDKVKRLAQDMKANGWKGPRLLVEETEQGYFAWTGSHRIAAARNVKVRCECVVITRKEADNAFGPHYSRQGHNCWREAVNDAEKGDGGGYDEDRLRGLQKAELVEAADALAAEIRRQNTDRYGKLEEAVRRLRKASLNYALWEKRLNEDVVKDEPFLLVIGNGIGIVPLIKVRFLDTATQTYRYGLFDAEHHRRVRGAIGELRPLLVSSIEA